MGVVVVVAGVVITLIPTTPADAVAVVAGDAAAVARVDPLAPPPSTVGAFEVLPFITAILGGGGGAGAFLILSCDTLVVVSTITLAVDVTCRLSFSTLLLCRLIKLCVRQSVMK